MAARYYPASKIKTNLSSNGGFLLDSNGNPYTGKYYVTYDGRFFSGPDPKIGPNKELSLVQRFLTSDSSGVANSTLNGVEKLLISKKTGIPTNFSPSAPNSKGKPVSHFPQPTDADYKRGYITRYFTKKKNERGFIIEISESEYQSITNGTADYSVSIYQVTKILWKLTGPLKSQRESQYNIIPGIIETNQRLTETADKTFLGIVDFIGGEYDRFAKPTA